VAALVHRLPFGFSVSGGGLLDRKALVVDLAFQAILCQPQTVRRSSAPSVNGVYWTQPTPARVQNSRVMCHL